MQKIINDAHAVVDDMLRGYIKCHPELVVKTDMPRVLKSRYLPMPGKVGIVSGGGSGHKPAFLGYVGKNMLDVVAVGNIFTPPTAEEFLYAFRAADNGAGVACLYGNYERDNKNVLEAIALAAKEGVTVKRVVANDDVASAPGDRREKRRGVAGEVLMWKVGGAAAAAGLSLDEVIEASQRAVDNMRSIGVGLSACTIPEVGVPNFEVIEGTMEVGIGHHGEPGIETYKLKPANMMADMMLEEILADYPYGAGDEVAVLVSGLGATTMMELYILFDEVFDKLTQQGLHIYRSFVGNYFTSLDMSGVSVTVMRLDGQLKRFLDMEADSKGFQWIND